MFCIGSWDAALAADLVAMSSSVCSTIDACIVGSTKVDVVCVEQFTFIALFVTQDMSSDVLEGEGVTCGRATMTQS